MTRGPRNGHAWRTVAAQVRRDVATGIEPGCWICRLPIDLTLPPRTPWSFSVDHVIPLHHGGPLLLRSNLRAAHLRCNVARSNSCDLCKPQQTRPLVTSRRW